MELGAPGSALARRSSPRKTARQTQRTRSRPRSERSHQGLLARGHQGGVLSARGLRWARALRPAEPQDGCHHAGSPRAPSTCRGPLSLTCWEQHSARLPRKGREPPGAGRPAFGLVLILRPHRPRSQAGRGPAPGSHSAPHRVPHLHRQRPLWSRSTWPGAVPARPHSRLTGVHSHNYVFF